MVHRRACWPWSAAPSIEGGGGPGGMGLLGVLGKYGMYRLSNTMALLDTHVRGGRRWLT